MTDACEELSLRTLQLAAGALLENVGFTHANQSSLDLLTDVGARFMRKICEESKYAAECVGRTNVDIDDLEIALKTMGISTTEMWTYMKDVGPIPGPKPLPLYPAPPADPTPIHQYPVTEEELRTRPPHIPPWAPGLYPPKAVTPPPAEVVEEQEVAKAEVTDDEFSEDKIHPWLTGFPDFTGKTSGSLGLRKCIPRSPPRPQDLFSTPSTATGEEPLVAPPVVRHPKSKEKKHPSPKKHHLPPHRHSAHPPPPHLRPEEIPGPSRPPEPLSRPESRIGPLGIQPTVAPTTFKKRPPKNKNRFINGHLVPGPSVSRPPISPQPGPSIPSSSSLPRQEQGPSPSMAHRPLSINVHPTKKNTGPKKDDRPRTPVHMADLFGDPSPGPSDPRDGALSSSSRRSDRERTFSPMPKLESNILEDPAEEVNIDIPRTPGRGTPDSMEDGPLYFNGDPFNRKENYASNPPRISSPRERKKTTPLMSPVPLATSTPHKPSKEERKAAKRAAKEATKAAAKSEEAKAAKEAAAVREAEMARQAEERQRLEIERLVQEAMSQAKTREGMQAQAALIARCFGKNNTTDRAEQLARTRQNEASQKAKDKQREEKEKQKRKEEREKQRREEERKRQGDIMACLTGGGQVFMKKKEKAPEKVVEKPDERPGSSSQHLHHRKEEEKERRREEKEKEKKRIEEEKRLEKERERERREEERRLEKEREREKERQRREEEKRLEKEKELERERKTREEKERKERERELERKAEKEREEREKREERERKEKAALASKRPSAPLRSDGGPLYEPLSPSPDGMAPVVIPEVHSDEDDTTQPYLMDTSMASDISSRPTSFPLDLSYSSDINSSPEKRPSSRFDANGEKRSVTPLKIKTSDDNEKEEKKKKKHHHHHHHHREQDGDGDEEKRRRERKEAKRRERRLREEREALEENEEERTTAEAPGIKLTIKLGGGSGSSSKVKASTTHETPSSSSTARSPAYEEPGPSASRGPEPSPQKSPFKLKIKHMEHRPHHNFVPTMVVQPPIPGVGPSLFQPRLMNKAELKATPEQFPSRFPELTHKRSKHEQTDEQKEERRRKKEEKKRAQAETEKREKEEREIKEREERKAQEEAEKEKARKEKEEKEKKEKEKKDREEKEKILKENSFARALLAAEEIDREETRKKEIHKEMRRAEMEAKAAASMASASSSAVASTSSDNAQRWFCPTCKLEYSSDGPAMIGCDECDDWYHWSCVGMLVAPDDDSKWYCVPCTAKRSRGSSLTKKDKSKKRPSSSSSSRPPKKNKIDVL